MDRATPDRSAAPHALAALAGWPRRRWLLAVPAAVVLAGAFRSGATGQSTAPLWWEWLFVVLASVLGALLVASYLALPGSGRVLDRGCSPCAASAGVTLVLALMARGAAPDNAGMAVLALALLVGGLRQRLSGGTSCGVRP